jgi:hypothetical protein
MKLNELLCNTHPCISLCVFAMKLLREKNVLMKFFATPSDDQHTYCMNEDYTKADFVKQSWLC